MSDDDRITASPRPTPGPPSRPGSTRESSLLPDWMRDPPPPRRTLGGRVTAAFTRIPGAERVQRRWWAWQGRTRLHQRFPVAFKVTAFFASWILALALFLLVYMLFAMA